MRRFSQDDLLDHKVRCGAADAALFERLAATIAAFHARTAVAAADSVHGSPANITQPARENFEQIAALMPPDASQEVLSKLRAWTASESARLETVFLQRKAGGHVRECHGDLHLGNIAVILEKSAAHAEAKKIDQSVFFSARLFPDMFTLSKQVQIAADMAKGGVARLAGEEPPRFEDTETTLTELVARGEHAPGPHRGRMVAAQRLGIRSVGEGAIG